MHAFTLFGSLLYCVTLVQGSITVYKAIPPGATGTASGNGATYTAAAAYDPLVLTPPPIPNPPPPTTFSLQLQSTADTVPGLSIFLNGGFWGFSIEFSVITEFLGSNSTMLMVPFLNLMSILNQRAGRVVIRVGGNTQEEATLVDNLPGGKILEKTQANQTNPTQTPVLLYTPDVFYMLANISSLVNAKWYLGVPLNDTANLRLQIAEYGQRILGDNLLGLQVGNEPDLYASHGHRPATYGPSDYFGDFGLVISAMQSDTNMHLEQNLLGPSVATGDWTPEMVWDTGFIPAYTNYLGGLTVEHYPSDNCFALYGTGSPADLQAKFPSYLNHTAGIALIAPYLNSSNIAQAAGKPLYMFETNTASCGGFPGISDTFGSALWALDYGLQLAYSNFSGGMLHVGGQDVYYNPFSAPPTNQSSFQQWTVGPIFYATVIIAEAFGSSNRSQIVDLGANAGNIFTPAYAIYENGQPAKLALFNYMTDPSGASNYTASFAIGGTNVGQSNGTPQQVKVKYFLAPSVSEKSNITWAGQTFGGYFASDGRLTGSMNVQTITCNSDNTCDVQVPAPGFALVFLNNDVFGEVTPQATKTFSTSIATSTINTATIDPSVLATSNGESGGTRKLGSTSRGRSQSGAFTSVPRSTMLGLIATITIGAMITFVLPR